MWSFRHRIKLSGGAALDIKEESIVLAEGEGQRVTLRSLKEGVTIDKATDLALYGNGFATEAQAREAGERYSQALMRALFEARIGADFGRRAPHGSLTEAGKAQFENASGARVLHDDHGLMVYQTEPPPVFTRFTGAGARIAKPNQFLETFARATQSAEPIAPNRRLAFEFFSASFFVKNADARFIMLFMAFEAMVQQRSRSPAAVEAIDAMTRGIEANDSIPNDEKESLRGGMARLRQESIKQAGKRLVAVLGDEKIGGKPALEFYRDCAEMRHALVHGNAQGPAYAEVGSAAASLEVLVSRVFAMTERDHEQPAEPASEA